VMLMLVKVCLRTQGWFAAGKHVRLSAAAQKGAG